MKQWRKRGIYLNSTSLQALVLRWVTFDYSLTFPADTHPLTPSTPSLTPLFYPLSTPPPPSPPSFQFTGLPHAERKKFTPTLTHPFQTPSNTPSNNLLSPHLSPPLTLAHIHLLTTLQFTGLPHAERKKFMLEVARPTLDNKVRH